MARKSVMTHQFSRVPQAATQRSSFNRSSGLKTTLNGGELVPVFVDEVLPGDSFNMRMSAFGRLATPIKPVLDNLFFDSFFFFVPYRLVWDNWQKFNGEQVNPGDSTDFVIPKLASPTPVNTGAILDYMGIPPGVIPDSTPISALPFRAYNLIYNEWFRDQNLQNSRTVNTDDGPDAVSGTYQVFNRGKRHDYFTSCLPWPQKGDPVTVPLGLTAPVVPDPTSQEDILVRDAAFTDTILRAEAVVSPNVGVAITPSAGGLKWGHADGSTNLIADLANATGFTINQLRQSFQIQKLLERDARGGTRYTEIIRSHFGVTSPDARLQRPEFLGGGSSMININPVPQMTQTTANPQQLVDTAQGNLAAYGTLSANGHGFTKSFTEHGCIIGLVNVRADLTYQQGLNRMFSRNTRYDFYWPALAHIGEQAVLSKEIFCDSTAADDDVFGYQERYAEYRYKPSQITGEFRSAAPAPLDYWHLSLDFETRPVLDAAFILDTPPIDRIVAVPSEPHILLDCYFHLRCARPMPLYGVPGLIDHF